MRQRSRARTALPALMVLFAVLAASFAPASGADGPDDSPLRVWVIDDAGNRYPDPSGWESTRADPAHVRGDGSYGLTFVVENTAEAPITDVALQADGFADCTRSIGTVAPGAIGRRSYRCVVAADEFVERLRAAMLTSDTLDPSWPAGSLPFRDEVAASEVRVTGRLGGRVVSTDLECLNNHRTTCLELHKDGASPPELRVGLSSTDDAPPGRRAVRLTVTNPASEARFLGAVAGVARPSLPAPWAQAEMLACGSLPSRVEPGGSVTALCTWTESAGSDDEVTVTIAFPGESPISLSMARANALIAASPSSLSISVTPRDLVVGPGGAPDVTVTVTNSGAEPITGVSVEQPTASMPVLADCAADLGTLAGGESSSYTCTGSDWAPERTFFRVTGSVAGRPGPASAVTSIDLFDNRAGLAPRFEVEVVPPVQSGPPGTDVEVILRVDVPATTDSMVWWNLHVFDEQHPACDAYAMYSGMTVVPAPKEFRCRITVPAATAVSYEPTIVLHEWDPRPAFWDPTAAVPQRWSVRTVRADVLPGGPRDLSLTVTPLAATIRRGGSTEMEVTVVNTSDELVGNVETVLVHPATEHDVLGWPFLTELSEKCDREVGVLAPGEQRTYRCEIRGPDPGSRPGNEPLQTTVFTGHATGWSDSGRPAVATGRAELTVDTADRLAVELIGPSASVRVGEVAEFRVRVLNRGGTEYDALSIWSADLPGCDQLVVLTHWGETNPSHTLPAGNADSAVEFSCEAVAGEQLLGGEVQLYVVGMWLEEGGSWPGRVVDALAAVTIQEGEVPVPTTSAPTPTTPTPTPTPTTVPPVTVPPAPTVSPASLPPGVPPTLVPPSPTSASPTVGPTSEPSTNTSPAGAPVDDPESPIDTAWRGEAAEPPDDATVEVRGRTEIAAPRAESNAVSPSARTQRAEAYGLVSSAQPTTSVMLVLLVALVAFLAVRPLVTQPGRSSAAGRTPAADEESA